MGGLKRLKGGAELLSSARPVSTSSGRKAELTKTGGSAYQLAIIHVILAALKGAIIADGAGSGGLCWVAVWLRERE